MQNALLQYYYNGVQLQFVGLLGGSEEGVASTCGKSEFIVKIANATPCAADTEAAVMLLRCTGKGFSFSFLSLSSSLTITTSF